MIIKQGEKFIVCGTFVLTEAAKKKFRNKKYKKKVEKYIKQEFDKAFIASLESLFK